MKKILLFAFTIFSVHFASAQVTSTYVDDAPYNYEEVDEKPQFPGGIIEFKTFVGKNLNLSDYEGGSGVLKVSFIIEANGEVSNAEITEDLGGGVGKEVKRVVSLSPRWMPGRNSGKIVRVMIKIPLRITG
ncbi:energy transducer TonB [Flavobacterium aestivum]|uniref:energy transducer TonB n=1 Tax=Flavobacterium aestivum TaxID=3003257 RepID=UPI0024832224|nr:energy transducer TonB [Flavobacterium aestivum]